MLRQQTHPLNKHKRPNQSQVHHHPRIRRRKISNRVLYRETHTLLDELAEATLDGTRKECMEFLGSVPLLIIDDLGMRKLP